jgi:hypothetical protein
MKPATLGGHEDSRAAQVEAIIALDRIERSAVVEIGAAKPVRA